MVAERCWKTVGIEGDGSCPELAALAHCRNCPEYARAGRALLERGVSEEQREQWTRAVSEPPPEEQAETVPVVVFRVGEEWLALNAQAIVRAVEARPAHTVPGRTGGAFLGLVNVDGELLLNWCPARLMGLELNSQPRRLLVAARDSERFVFSAEEVLGLRRVPRTALENPPATLTRAPATFTTAMFDLDGRNVALLDENRLFESAARSLE